MGGGGGGVPANGGAGCGGRAGGGPRGGAPPPVKPGSPVGGLGGVLPPNWGTPRFLGVRG